MTLRALLTALLFATGCGVWRPVALPVTAHAEEAPVTAAREDDPTLLETAAKRRALSVERLSQELAEHERASRCRFVDVLRSELDLLAQEVEAACVALATATGPRRARLALEVDYVASGRATLEASLDQYTCSDETWDAFREDSIRAVRDLRALLAHAHRGDAP